MKREPTRLPRWLTAPYGRGTLHAALFEHAADKGGPRPTVAVMLPEASSQLEIALGEAHARQARLLLVTDTAAQADEAAAEVTRRLPEHRRVSLSRAAAGGWGLQ